MFYKILFQKNSAYDIIVSENILEVLIMSGEKVIFCGNNPDFLDKKLTTLSDGSNGGNAFRIPSLIRIGNTLIAAIDRQSCGADWGYIELAIRRSEDGGETWSDIQIIAIPPARKTMLSDECYGSAFYIDPCMAIAPNGDVLLLVDFYPECKGLHKRSILDKKKAPYALYNKEMRPTLYDRDGKFYVIDKSGHVLNHRYTDTGMTVDYESGELYSGEAYLGNIHLNGKSPSNINEAGAKTTFGAPLKAPKRNYLYLLRSSDNGKTWSKPKDITGQVLIKQDGTFLGVAPGVGLTTHKGRVIMPLYVDRKQTVSIYSIDDGENWHRMAGHPYAENVDEWQMVQAPSGAIIGLGRAKRYGKTPMSISYDDGKTWIKAGKTDLYAPKCQKSVISIGDYVFCSHPNDKTRSNGVITVGKFYKAKGRVAGINWYSETEVNKGFFAYSCLTRIDDEHIGILYESEPSSFILFKKYKIKDLI